MCGIVGIVGRNANQKTVDAMLRTQHHRGPDFTASKAIASKIALGHNRLAIIDLSPEANQPMYDRSRRYEIIFNGEIYNYIELKTLLSSQYTFRTKSDTEVLLAAYVVWGEAMLEKLNGMFAFAIYDNLKDELFAARDRFGVKPFYYIQYKGSLYFASEIKAFEAANIKLFPNEKVWSEYLNFGSYGSPSETFWENIKQLEPGCSLYYDGNLKHKRWYDFVSRIKSMTILEYSIEEVQNQYEALLIDSVNLRFQADVKVGFNLSGGLDSSTLLAMVHQIHSNNIKNIRAYTFYTGDKRYDEDYWVDKMLKQTGNPLTKVLLHVNDIPKIAKKLTEIQYEPYGGIPTIAYYNLFKQARKDNTLVLLDGQGMDEQWAGYDYYTSSSHNLVQGVRTSATRVNVLNIDFAKIANKNEYPQPFSKRLQNLQYRDLFYTKIPRTLRFNDRISMASSVELREPFLDYRLVELAFSQPESYKIRNNQKKWMLRQIAQKYLNTEIVTAPKRPLQTPQREWLGNALSKFVDEQIEHIATSELRCWFNIDEMYKEWEAYKNGKQENAFYIWQWISVGLMITTWKEKR